MSKISSSQTETSVKRVGLVLCVRAARSILGWSQAELAAEAQISKPALNRLERFESEPRLETMYRIEEVIARAGVHIEYGDDGDFHIAIRAPVIRDMCLRIDAVDSVTSRGKLVSPPQVQSTAQIIRRKKEAIERRKEKGSDEED